MKYLKRGALILTVILVITVIYQYPKLNIISGYAAKNMASTVFIANRTAKSVNNHDHRVPLIKLAETNLNAAEQSATSSVFGLMKRRAVFREGLGSVLLNDKNPILDKFTIPIRNTTYTSTPFPYGNGAPEDTIFGRIDYPGLQKAIDNAFSEPEVQRTRTVMVLYKNRMIAEKYAQGFDRNTIILGWSMTKSILATLYGIMVSQQRIDLYSPAGWKGWESDERSNITYNDLLRMQSSLEWDEDYTTISDVTRMLFMEANMGEVQAGKELLEEPGEIWNYSSGTSNLLSRMLRELEDTYQDYLNFPYKELIDRIGMNSMFLETDMAGYFVGSSYGWASTADWAKFGTLYLNRGNWQGEQIFEAEWIDYITTPTKNSDGAYGAHFWLNANGVYPD
ncbi:MAG: serine hydrolase domain-containing protein, partial [Flavobacteriaceae bacterium]